MRIACYRPIVIRSKADAKKFLRYFTGYMYIDAGEDDLWIEYEGKTGEGTPTVTTRPVSMRGSIFNPAFVESDPVGAIYKYRKYVNAKVNGD